MHSPACAKFKHGSLANSKDMIMQAATCVSEVVTCCFCCGVQQHMLCLQCKSRKCTLQQPDALVSIETTSITLRCHAVPSLCIVCCQALSMTTCVCHIDA